MDNQPKQSTVSATALQRESGSILRRVGIDMEHIIVERDGFQIAVIIPIAEYERLTKTSS